MASGRGGARSGAGRKPGSKNRLTKAAKATLTELAQEYTKEALDVLAEVMRDAEAPHAARVSAADKILDRGHGKPIQATAEMPTEQAAQVFDGWAIGRVQSDQD